MQEVWQEIERLKRRLEPDMLSNTANVSEERMQACELRLGQKLSADLRALVPLAAAWTVLWSQPDREDEADDEEFDFGDVSFFGPDTIAEVWESYRANEDNLEYSVAIGPVRAARNCKERIPFAGDIGAGVFWIDLNPTPEGEPGQVIWTYDEGSTVRVIAEDLEAFLRWGLACLKFQHGLQKRAPLLPFHLAPSSTPSDTLLGPELVRLRERFVALIDELRAVGRKRAKLREPTALSMRMLPAAKPDAIDRAEKRLKRLASHEYRFLIGQVGDGEALWTYDVSRFPATVLWPRGGRPFFSLWGLQGFSESLRWDAEHKASLRDTLERSGLTLAPGAELIMFGSAVGNGVYNVSYYQEVFSDRRLDQSRVIAIGEVSVGGLFTGEIKKTAWIAAESIEAFFQEGLTLAKAELVALGG